MGDFKLLLDEGKCKYNKIEPAIVRAFEETLTYAKDIFENTIKPIIRDEVESAQWIQNSQWDFDQWAQRLEIGELANYSFLRSENKNHYSEEKELFHKICGIGLTFGAYTNRALTTLCLGTLIEMESSRQRGGFWGFGTLAHEHGHAIGAFSARELRSCLIDHHPNDTHDRKRTYENKQKKKEIASDLWASVFFSRWSVEHNVRFETLRGHLIRYCPQDKLDQTSYPPSHFRIRWIAQYPPLREALGCKTQPKIPMTCYPEK